MNRSNLAITLALLAGSVLTATALSARPPETAPAAPTAAPAPAEPAAAPTSVGDAGRVFELKSAKGRVLVVHALPDLSSSGARHSIAQFRELGPTIAGVTTVFAVALPADRFTAELAAVPGGAGDLPIYRDEGGAFATSLGAPAGVHSLVIIGGDGLRLFGVPADKAGHIDFAPLVKRIDDTTKDRETNHANLENGLSLQGYDAVEYLDNTKAVKGTPGIETTFRGIRYRFASKENRAKFNAAPEKYLPAYGGWCATAIAKGDKVEVDPTNFKVTNGRVFLFYNGFWGNALTDWNKDEQGLTGKADGQWRTLIRKR